MSTITDALRANLHRIIRGNDRVIDLIVTCLCSESHALLEGVPGVGKTTLAKAMARSIEGTFHRIQFTPDLLPTDIAGGMVYSPTSGDFSFRPGPVFCNVLLADEINRASPRTQSALLEAMSERQVTVEGETRPLPDPFIVFATQNPIEYHGTYPLPEAQLDRFAMRLEVEYPSAEEEVQILLDQQREHPLVNLKTVARNQDMLAEIESAQAVAIDPALTQYITDLVRATREDARIQLGASPRAALLLHRTSRALAYIRNRDFVTPDDVKTLAVPVLAHRLVLETRTSYAGGDKQAIVSDVIETVKAPR